MYDGVDDCDRCVCMSEDSMHSLHLSFTCQTAVNDRIISGNLDSPEGGLDGLLQAVVCKDVSTQSHCNTICKCTCASQHTCILVLQPTHVRMYSILQIIGWRDNPARRLLVYMTDADFHFGADGKVGCMVYIRVVGNLSQHR